MDKNRIREDTAIQITLPQLGVYMTQLPKDIVNKLNVAADNIQKSWDAPKFNDQLVGHMKHQYQLTNIEYLSDYIMGLSKTYYEYLNAKGYVQYVFDKPIGLKFGDPWINFQGPREFNPIHNHSGLLSWVIWLRIPFDPKKEQDFFPDYPFGKVMNGSFQFIYPSQKGVELHLMDLDKSYEGRLIVFPSTLYHQVYPFYTTEDYRVSIAGNIYAGEINNDIKR